MLKKLFLMLMFFFVFSGVSSALVKPAGYENQELQYFIMNPVPDGVGGQDLLIVWYDLSDQIVGSTSLGDFPTGYKIVQYGVTWDYNQFIINFLMGLAGLLCAYLVFGAVLRSMT